MGICGIYVRSPIADLGETRQTQAFFAVGFNPYGRRILSNIRPVRRTWETIHNRVTSNVLNRFKCLCEVGFQAAREGSVTSSGDGSRESPEE